MPSDPTESASSTNHVGPIVFSNPIARQQLVEHGEVVTFRAGERTTGETWWRESRTGEKEGDCTVEEVAECTPYDEALRPHWELSGFDSVMAWQEAIEDYHGGLPDGHLYRVTLGHGNSQSACAICGEPVTETDDASSHPEGVVHDECETHDGTDTLPDGGQPPAHDDTEDAGKANDTDCLHFDVNIGDVIETDPGDHSGWHEVEAECQDCGQELTCLIDWGALQADVEEVDA